MSDLNRNWRWERKGCRVYTDQMHRGRPMKVAEVCIPGLDEDGLEARGRLIAAAPDLLEALQPLAPADDATAEHFASMDPDDTVTITVPVRCILRARAAITRADGGGA